MGSTTRRNYLRGVAIFLVCLATYAPQLALGVAADGEETIDGGSEYTYGERCPPTAPLACGQAYEDTSRNNNRKIIDGCCPTNYPYGVSEDDLLGLSGWVNKCFSDVGEAERYCQSLGEACLYVYGHPRAQYSCTAK